MNYFSLIIYLQLHICTTLTQKLQHQSDPLLWKLKEIYSTNYCSQSHLNLFLSDYLQLCDLLSLGFSPKNKEKDGRSPIPRVAGRVSLFSKQRKALHWPPSSDLKDKIMRNSPVKSYEQIPVFIQNHVKKCFVCFVSSLTESLLNYS